MKNDELYLLHISDAIAQIELYVAGLVQPAFMQNRLVQDAVVRQLEIVGEASRRLSEDFKTRHANVP